ncbi:unnamed protein product [Rhizophagus irregularis]|nr:unnamed protein product [Rhizophagus irregularis]
MHEGGKTIIDDLFAILQLLLPDKNIGIYHGGLGDEQRESIMSCWKNGKIQIMIGTNAFGMVLLFCQNQYECRIQLISQYHFWNGDNIPSPCLKCDNCKNRITEQPTYENCIEEVFHLLEIIEEISNNNYEIIEDDVVEVFCKSNTKKIQESGLNELEIYKSGRKPKFGKSKEFSGYILADLIVRGYVEQKTLIHYSSPNAQTLSASVFIEGLMTEAKARVIEDSWYYWVHRK